MLFFKKSFPIVASFLAAASSRMYSSRSIAINCSGESKARKYSTFERWLFHLEESCRQYWPPRP
jgi:hypothetical protein